MRSEAGSIYRFDEFLLDAERGALFHANGAPLTLRPKACAALRLLLEEPGRVHGRDELMDRLWPGLSVTDDSLTQCMGELRRAFGDRAGQVLRTLPRRGYALTCDVLQEHPAAALPAPAPDVAAGRRDTILVDPVASFSASPHCASYAHALTSDLRAELAQFEELRVLRASDHALPGAYRLRGEVRLRGPSVAGLIHLETDGETIWSERFEHGPDQTSPPVAFVALLVARIELQVNRASLGRAGKKRPGALSVRELCLLGRQHHQHGTKAGTYAAQEAFGRAVAADSASGLAHAWLSFTVMRTVTHGWTEADQDERARSLQIARRSVELEPASPLCLSALAFALALNERWDEAAEMARLSLGTGRPADFGTRLSCGEVLAAAGLPEEAAATVQAVYALDPHAPPRGRAVLGRALLLAGRAEEALAELRRCTARQPDYAPCYRSIVVAAVETGRLLEARAALAEIARLQPNWLPGARPIQWFLRRPADIARFERAFRVASVAVVGDDGVARAS